MIKVTKQCFQQIPVNRSLSLLLNDADNLSNRRRTACGAPALAASESAGVSRWSELRLAGAAKRGGVSTAS